MRFPFIAFLLHNLQLKVYCSNAQFFVDLLKCFEQVANIKLFLFHSKWYCTGLLFSIIPTSHTTFERPFFGYFLFGLKNNFRCATWTKHVNQERIRCQNLAWLKNYESVTNLFSSCMPSLIFIKVHWINKYWEQASRLVLG